MNDNQLKQLFSDFEPRLSDDSLFMSKLTRNLDSVEFIKARNVANHRKNRLAMWIASIAGMVMGILMTLIFPQMENWLTELNTAGPAAVDFIDIYKSTILWVFICIMTIISAIVAYGISSSMITKSIGGQAGKA